MKKLQVTIGVNDKHRQVKLDIGAMPHALIAGTTGSGKSAFLNMLLCSLFTSTTPKELQVIIIDPKRVEFMEYAGVPHLLMPVITEPEHVLSVLTWLTAEMENRYKILELAGVKNIDSYNKKMSDSMPRILLIIDELADLMFYAKDAVEDTITRLTQLSRAVGIHVILTTQRPTVHIIPGSIKTNIPTRIAFKLPAVTDSRVILDQRGAEKLTRKGEFIFISPTSFDTQHVQAKYFTDWTVKKMIRSITR